MSPSNVQCTNFHCLLLKQIIIIIAIILIHYFIKGEELFVAAGLDPVRIMNSLQLAVGRVLAEWITN